MKKRNVMTMALSLAMVGVIAVGGTLAYLTATDGSVTNTFAFVTKDAGDTGVINVKLEEGKPFEAGSEGVASVSSNTQGGYDYTNVVPNQTLPKAPEVSVKTKVESYVYVRVTEGTGETAVTVKEDTLNSNWTLLESASTETSKVYYYKTPVAPNTKYESLGNIFTEVQIPNIATENEGQAVQLQNVKIEVAAIQTDASFETAVDAYTEGNVAAIFKTVAD